MDKEQLETGEQVDGATIEIEPLEKGGVIDGGTWSIAPAGVQTVTTNGHTQDSNYQYNGGEASTSWRLRYEVSKTSVTSLSGREGPYKSQAEADAAAASAQSAAESQLRAEAQGMVDRAIAAAKNNSPRSISVLMKPSSPMALNFGAAHRAASRPSLCP